MNYQEFLETKAQKAPRVGLSNTPKISGHLFPFQRHCVEFLLGVGSGGLFLDTGLGKTLVQLEYAEHARQATNGWALILTPLAVAKQIEREARKFGYDARVIRDQSEAREGINICNYDRLHLIEPATFGVVTLDEASILKAFGGKTTRALTEAFRRQRFRMPATATPAPNDHMELGQYADFCGVMASNEMLSRFFINDTSQASQQWRLKRHGVESFWDWMASWCRLAQLPSDLGGDDTDFVLPPIKIERHRAAESAPTVTGGLFGDDPLSATNLHEVKRATAASRAAIVCNVVYNWQSCGSQNTQLQDERNAQPCQLKRSAQDTVELQSKIANTCAPITPPTNTDGLGALESNVIDTTRIDDNNMPRTPPTENAKRKSLGNTPEAADARLQEDCTIWQRAASPQNSTSGFTPNSPDDAPSVTQSISDCGQITATRMEPPAVYFAPDAILGSVSSETTSRFLREPFLIFVDTDYEQDAVEAALTKAFGRESFFSVRGSQSSEHKEACIEGWIEGHRPLMLSKASIIGFGMNFQFCAQMIFVGRSFSYESWYQAVRRCWRFGQQRTVHVHLIVAAGEDSIGRVIDRKADDHASMKTAMREAMRRNRGRESATKVAYQPTVKGRLPSWIA